VHAKTNGELRFGCQQQNRAGAGSGLAPPFDELSGDAHVVRVDDAAGGLGDEHDAHPPTRLEPLGGSRHVGQVFAAREIQ
jgi:hypothetical protein